MRFEQLKIWIEALRPKTLWASFAPVLIGTAMAYSDGKWDPIIAIFTMISAVLIQIGTNFANDYFDFFKGADTKKRIGPVRATASGLVKPKTMKIAYFTTFSFSIVFGFYLIERGGWPILIIGIFSVLFGILYTGGPFPLGYKGLGEIFVLIFFGPVAVGGTYYLQTQTINQYVMIAGLAPGLFSVAILTVNNFRDIETDKAANKKTLAVRFGKEFAITQYISTVIAASLIPIILCVCFRSNYWSLISILTLIIAVSPIKMIISNPDAETLNKMLAKTGILLIIYSILFAIGWTI